MAKHVLSLQQSEIGLLHAASQIYTAYIHAGRVREENENVMIERSINEALRMAHLIEEAVQSDSEMG